jgi:hypothetical protein
MFILYAVKASRTARLSCHGFAKLFFHHSIIKKISARLRQCFSEVIFPRVFNLGRAPAL